jgi:hypothetical protein
MGVKINGVDLDDYGTWKGFGAHQAPAGLGGTVTPEDRDAMFAAIDAAAGSCFPARFVSCSNCRWGMPADNPNWGRDSSVRPPEIASLTPKTYSIDTTFGLACKLPGHETELQTVSSGTYYVESPVGSMCHGVTGFWDQGQHVAVTNSPIWRYTETGSAIQVLFHPDRTAWGVVPIGGFPGTAVTPSGWIENTFPSDQNPEALSDGDDATYGVEAYPNGVAGMTYPEAFVATGVYMRQKAGGDTLGIGGFGKNSAAAWHVDAWPASAGSAPPPWGDWSSAGVTIASFPAYSQDYSANISGAPAASVYRLVMDGDAYTGGDARNSWIVYEFVLYEGGALPNGVPASGGGDLIRFPVGGIASYSAIEEFSAGYAAANAANGYYSTTDGGTGVSWAAVGWSSGDWWQVDWSVGQSLSRVKLYDRGPGGDTFGTGGRLTFSDGSTVSWSGLTDGGTLTIDFTRKTGITWMRVVSDTGGTGNAGLAGVEAFDV